MKDIISIKEIVSGLIAGIIVGIVILMITIFLEQNIFFDRANRKVNEADNSNLFVACQIKLTLKQENKNLLIKYDTQAYKENFDSLSKQESLIKEAIKNNIFLMEASNKMMDLIFEQPQKQDEFKSKLINNADKIIKNLDVYNIQNIGECANY